MMIGTFSLFGTGAESPSNQTDKGNAITVHSKVEESQVIWKMEKLDLIRSKKIAAKDADRLAKDKLRVALIKETLAKERQEVRFSFV